MLGSLGDVVFESSAQVQRTFSELSRNQKARYAKHSVIGRKPVQQHLGSDLSEIPMSMRFDAQFVNPLLNIEKLQDLLDSGQSYTLVIGGKPLGDFILIQLDDRWERFDGKGRLLLATATIKLREYIP